MSDEIPQRPNGGKSMAGLLYLAIGCVALALLVVSVVAWSLRQQTQQRQEQLRQLQADARRAAEAAEQERLRLPDVATSSFRNTTPTTKYVGNGQCQECHQGEHQSYLQTTHSRSMEAVKVAQEPPDGEFFHEISGRHYRVYRDGESLKLREFIQDDQGQEVVLTDQVAQYALGSGNYARMYLVRDGDFLIEAPMTWYPRRQTWGMSAGYEKDAHQQGFSREIDSNCLHCHAGKVDVIDQANLRLHIDEMAISCERCHGPGSLHVNERKAGLPIKGVIDDSIVNLRHLSREKQEDVCAQCHLSGSADVSVRGRSKADFRPGLRLADFVVSFRVDRQQSEMTVSGQIQQMRLSRCYQGSKSMTCATCHDPHAVPDKSQTVTYFRDKCLTCHREQSCKMPVAERRQKQAQDYCVTCHMPSGPTDIPHFSFTHHRVGIHAEQPKFDRYTAADQLVGIGDLSHLPELERLRLLGLANDTFAGKLSGGLNDEFRDDPTYRQLADVFTNRGRQILEKLQSQGLQDPEVDTFFSRLNWRRDADQCIAFAEAAMKSKQILPGTRASALYYLASSRFDRREYEQALPLLEELVKIERSEITLMLLAICYQREGKLSEALELVNKALLDSPDRADLHLYLASIYDKLDKTDEAESHRQRASLLTEKVPQPK